MASSRSIASESANARTLAEYGLGEQIGEILIDEQGHQIALATALGKTVATQRDDQF